MRTPFAPWLVALALVVASPAVAEIYKWTDANGVVHFTSNASEVPADQREGARKAGSAGKGSFQQMETVPRPREGAASSKPATQPSHFGGSAARRDSADTPKEPRFGGRTEAQWRAQAAKYRNAIARLEANVEKCSGDQFRWSRGAGRRAYKEEQREAQACQTQKNELDMNRRWLSKLEENARRAGAPPGWLR